MQCFHIHCRPGQQTGEMLEWLKRHAWKACILLKGIASSNLALSAKHFKLSAQRWAFFVQSRQELAHVRLCKRKAQRP